jgi:hypothetical protein
VKASASNWYDYQEARLTPRCPGNPTKVPHDRPEPALDDESFQALKDSRLDHTEIEVTEQSLTDTIIDRIPLLGKLRATFGK